MEATGHIEFSASPARIWQAMTDPQILRLCVPGCHEVQQITANQFRFMMQGEWGPIKAAFHIDVKIEDIVEFAGSPSAYTLCAEGHGALGLAKGTARVELNSHGATTQLTYRAHGHADARLRKFGGVVLRMVARKLADGFFQRFKAALEHHPALL